MARKKITDSARYAKDIVVSRQKVRASGDRHRADPAVREQKRAYLKEYRRGVHRIYVLTNPAWPGRVKVGLTRRRPSIRLSSFNTGDPDKAYTYAALVHVEDARRAEKLIHDTLHNDHVSGEWYSTPVEVVIRLAETLRYRREPCERS